MYRSTKKTMGRSTKKRNDTPLCHHCLSFHWSFEFRVLIYHTHLVVHLCMCACLAVSSRLLQYLVKGGFVRTPLRTPLLTAADSCEFAFILCHFYELYQFSRFYQQVFHVWPVWWPSMGHPPVNCMLNWLHFENTPLTTLVQKFWIKRGGVEWTPKLLVLFGCDLFNVHF